MRHFLPSVVLLKHTNTPGRIITSWPFSNFSVYWNSLWSSYKRSSTQWNSDLSGFSMGSKNLYIYLVSKVISLVTQEGSTVRMGLNCQPSDL